MVSHCQDHSCFSATTVLPLALGCHPTRNGVVMALSTQDFCPFIKEEWTKKRTRKVHVIQTVIFPFSGSWTVYSRNVWICLLIFSRPEGYLFSVYTNGSPDPYYIPSGLPPFGSLLCCWCPTPHIVTASCPGWSSTERGPPRGPPQPRVTTSLCKCFCPLYSPVPQSFPPNPSPPGPWKQEAPESFQHHLPERPSPSYLTWSPLEKIV